jgi:hypothetical protein
MALAHSTAPLTVRQSDQISTIKRVPIFAMCLHCPPTSTMIFEIGDWFEMIWIDATFDPAKMIEL